MADSEDADYIFTVEKALREARAELSAAKAEIERLKYTLSDTDKYVKAQYKGYDEEVAALREALEKIVKADNCWGCGEYGHVDSPHNCPTAIAGRALSPLPVVKDSLSTAADEK